MLQKIPTPVAVVIVVILVLIAGWVGYRSFFSPVDYSVDPQSMLPPRNEQAPDVTPEEEGRFVAPRALK